MSAVIERVAEEILEVIRKGYTGKTTLVLHPDMITVTPLRHEKDGVFQVDWILGGEVIYSEPRVNLTSYGAANFHTPVEFEFRMIPANLDGEKVE